MIFMTCNYSIFLIFLLSRETFNYGKEKKYTTWKNGEIKHLSQYTIFFQRKIGQFIPPDSDEDKKENWIWRGISPNEKPLPKLAARSETSL